MVRFSRNRETQPVEPVAWWVKLAIALGSLRVISTWSASAMSAGGTSRPRVPAVLSLLNGQVHRLLDQLGAKTSVLDVGY